MELKEFISSTLTQIAEGVRDAQKNYSEIGGIVNPRGFTEVAGDLPYVKPSRISSPVFISDVHFDVALSSETSSKDSGGIGVLLGAFSVGGKIASSDAATSLSRISFNIPVVLPFQKNQKSDSDR